MDIKENPDTAQIESSAQGEQAPEAADSAKSRKAWVALVIFAVIITVVAWVAMVYNEYVSFYSAVAGLVGAVAGAILVGKGTWRNVAITSAIAAGVLALVFGLLWAAWNILVK